MEVRATIAFQQIAMHGCWVLHVESLAWFSGLKIIQSHFCFWKSNDLSLLGSFFSHFFSCFFQGVGKLDLTDIPAEILGSRLDEERINYLLRPSIGSTGRKGWLRK